MALAQRRASLTIKSSQLTVRPVVQQRSSIGTVVLQVLCSFLRRVASVGSDVALTAKPPCRTREISAATSGEQISTSSYATRSPLPNVQKISGSDGVPGLLTLSASIEIPAWRRNSSKTASSTFALSSSVLMRVTEEVVPGRHQSCRNAHDTAPGSPTPRPDRPAWRASDTALPSPPRSPRRPATRRCRRSRRPRRPAARPCR